MEALNRNRWLSPLVLALMAAFYAVNALVWDNGSWFDLVVLAVLTAVVWWGWPGRRGAHVDHADAQALAGDDDVIVYWRPG